MKLVAVSRILDEADIVEAFVRHTAAYAQHHILLDNGSSDGTMEILRSLREEGLSLSVYRTRSVSFSEQAALTFLYEKAVREYGADWVSCLDADEFIDDRNLAGGLNAWLERDARQVECVKLPWVFYNYARTDDPGERIVPRRIVRRTGLSDSHKVIISRRMIDRGVVVDSGGHDILVGGAHPATGVALTDAVLAHYTERSAYQTVVKFTRGWIKAKAGGRDVMEKRAAIHYKEPFEYLRDTPANLLRSEWFMTRKNESDDQVVDPIDYKGGPLRYTPEFDPAMLAVRCLAGYLEALGDRHAEIIDTIPAAKAFVQQINQDNVRVF